MTLHLRDLLIGLLIAPWVLASVLRDLCGHQGRHP